MAEPSSGGLLKKVSTGELARASRDDDARFGGAGGRRAGKRRGEVGEEGCKRGERIDAGGDPIAQGE